MAGNAETSESWFTNVRSFLERVGLMKCTGPVADYASGIWNADETGFCLESTSKKILAICSVRSVREVSSASDHQYITVNVTGHKLFPFILYKGKHLHTTWTEGGPAAACNGISESGWMEESNYIKWFEQQFYLIVKHLLDRANRPFFDGNFHT